ncbi:MAG: uncharacterized protein PWP04_787 [Candidatus Atribacteria bacterium]|nr:uncharacterized protein [Candidatus Atribacteria bacterium]
MKVGILSDSHDNLTNLKKALGLFERERVDLVLHGGDYVAPFSVGPLAALTVPWWGVLGNNDGEVVGIFQKSDKKISLPFLDKEVQGYRIWLSHYPQPAELAFQSDKYQLVVYGHTHRALIEREGNSFLINPGETCGLLSGRSTVAICDLTEKVAKILDI